MADTFQSHTESRLTFLDVNTVADMLACSVRHVYRLAEFGQIPAPVKLGKLVRWNRAELEAWSVAGHPRCDGEEA